MPQDLKHRRRWPLTIAMTVALALPAIARAQPVVQPLPGVEARALNAALTRLGQDPRDVAALLDAGNAALAMDDIDAATGFFRRADQVSPGNPRVKAGLAGAMVRRGDPFGALPLFEEAERAGAIDGALIGDHGLAYDLVGDNATAQRYYRTALARSANDEISRRLSLSLAISGDKRGSEQVLSPLLQRRDQAAWRTRAFALAILNQPEEAVSIASSVLPRTIAEGIAPYLRYMPKLTHAQQAAAANFGAFPRASEIGRDDPRIAAFAGGRGGVASADAGLVPRGQPLGETSRARGRQASAEVRPSRAPRVVRVAPPEPMPAKETPALVAAPPQAAPARLALAPLTALPPPSAPPPAGPPSALAAAPPPPPPRDLADAFREFARPSTDASPAAGAVDIRSLRPAPAKQAARDARSAETAKPTKPPPPSHPSRIWVQVATGRSKQALGFDWRRMTRGSPEAFRGKQAFVSAWGQTNRLLTGPFGSEAAANQYIGQLRRADVQGAFVWNSPAGQIVDLLKP